MKTKINSIKQVTVKESLLAKQALSKMQENR